MIHDPNDLEKTTNVESFKLFLNNYDITCAFMSVFSEREVSQILTNATKKKPLIKYRKLLQSPEFMESIKVASGRRDERRIHSIRKFSFYKSAGSKSKLALQTYLDSFISYSIIRLGSFSDVKFEPDLIDKRITHTKREQYRVITTEALKKFYCKVQEQDFSDYNSANFDDFISLIEDSEFRSKLSEEGKESAFGLYLAGHTDPKINLLSLHFSNRDPRSLNEIFSVSIDSIKGAITDEDEVIQNISEKLERGNLVLKVMDLEEENHYQPNKTGLAYLLNKVSSSSKYSEELNEKSQQRLITNIAELNEDIATYRRASEEHVREKDSLNTEIERLRIKVSKLENAEPDFDPDEKYLELDEKYNSLDSEYQKVVGKNERLNTQIDKLKEKNKNFTALIDEKQGEIRNLEAELSSLRDEFDKVKVEPKLKEFYTNKTCLMVVGIDSTKENYEERLGKVFDFVEVVKHDGVKRTNPNDYDIVIVGTGATSHGDRFWLDKRHKKVIVYPGRPNTLLKHLYDTQLPESFKS